LKTRSERKNNKSIKLKALASKKINLKTTSVNLRRKDLNMQNVKDKSNKLNGKAVIYSALFKFSNSKKKDTKNFLG